MFADGLSRQPLLEADAELTVGILPKARNLAVASRPVEPDGLWLARAGFKPQRRIPALPSAGFECYKNLPRDAATPELRTHEHPFDLSDARLQRAEGAAGHRLTINDSDKERQTWISNVLRVQAVNLGGRVALPKVFVELLNEVASIVRVGSIKADDDFLWVVHGIYS